LYNVLITNNSKDKFTVTGYEGSDWGQKFKGAVVEPDATEQLVGGLTNPTSSSSNHWGWIFLAVNDSKRPSYQIYVSAGTDYLLYDYCVQEYDGGENRSGSSDIQGVTQVLTANDGVLFTFISSLFTVSQG
jgi:hypothetical protein